MAKIKLKKIQSLITPSIGVHVEQLEPTFTASRNIRYLKKI